MPFWVDWSIILLIPAILLSLYAQYKVKTTFSKYTRVPARSRLAGAVVARDILKRKGITVEVERIAGVLTDHYDPGSRVLRLSEPVYNSSSLAALGVAAHEVGHALQHEEGYFPLNFRNRLVPVANFGSWLAFPLLFIGLFTGITTMVKFGAFAFIAVVLFQVVTLPVEFNASHRAIILLTEGAYLTQEELGLAQQVLKAAALSYVAAVLMGFLNLLRLLFGSRVFPRRR